MTAVANTKEDNATEHEVSIFILVKDVEALISAARERVTHDMGEDTDVNELVPDGDTSAALRWLLDPGASPPGCEILDCTCE